MTTPTISQTDTHLVLPGLATAHSHAFQRALRGRTQRRATAANSFWSWRGLMFALAEQLDPDDIFHISRFAFIELLLSGITAVGEFHYLHHSPDGTPYANRLTMANAVIRAAQEAGIRISLIRAAYLRGGYQQPLAAGQKRFYDPTAAAVLADVDVLRQQYAHDPLVTIAVAAHSVRAVPRPAIRELAAYAEAHQLPFHMHVSEQRREIVECVAEHGRRPVGMLAEAGVINGRFVAVHATHLAPYEINLLGQAGATVCLCRTTERDLGDGLPQTAVLAQAGACFCVGVDSHASSDAFEELRAIELDDRTRTQQRHVAATAAELLTSGSQHGYAAIGLADCWHQDRVLLNRHDASLAGCDPNLLADAVIFGATPRAVDEVWVNGQQVIKNGRHHQYEAALNGYQHTLTKLFGVTHF